MLTEIDRLLAERPSNIIGIVCEDFCSPAFLHMSVVSYAMERNLKVIFLSCTRNEQALRFDCLRLFQEGYDIKNNTYCKL